MLVHSRTLPMTMDAEDDVLLALPLAILRLFGVFSPQLPRWRSCFLAAYRALLFIIVATGSALMAVQIVVADFNDLSPVIRAVDVWTLYMAGLYKWLYMTANIRRFAVLKATTASPPRPATVRAVNVCIVCYVVLGIVSALSIFLSPLMAHPKGYGPLSNPNSVPGVMAIRTRGTVAALGIGHLNAVPPNFKKKSFYKHITYISLCDMSTYYRRFHLELLDSHTNLLIKTQNIFSHPTRKPLTTPKKEVVLSPIIVFKKNQYFLINHLIINLITNCEGVANSPLSTIMLLMSIILKLLIVFTYYYVLYKL